jgi:hypothetical protein
LAKAYAGTGCHDSLGLENIRGDDTNPLAILDEEQAAVPAR